MNCEVSNLRGDDFERRGSRVSDVWQVSRGAGEQAVGGASQEAREGTGQEEGVQGERMVFARHAPQRQGIIP